MGTVVRQDKIGDSSITLSFENYQDFLDYQKKEFAPIADNDSVEQIKDFLNILNNRDEPKCHKIILSEEEYYYLSCILGHLVPAGDISKSLLDKVSLDDLDCEDFDRVFLSCTEIKLNENN